MRSCNEVAKDFGVDESTIRDYIAAAGIIPRGGGQGRAYRLDEDDVDVLRVVQAARGAGLSLARVRAVLNHGGEKMSGREAGEAAGLAGYAPCLRVRRIDPETSRVGWDLRRNVTAAWVEFLAWQGVPVFPRPEPSGDWSEAFFGIGGRHDIRILAARYGLFDEAIPAAELDLTPRPAGSPRSSRASSVSGLGVVKTATMELIDAETQKLIAASGGALPAHEARRRVFDHRPELYEAYRSETSRVRAVGGDD